MSEGLVRLKPGDDVAEIRLCECAQCGYRSFPPVLLGCERCGSESVGATWARATGHLLSRALVPLPKAEPLAIATIELDAGPVIRAQVRDPVTIGDQVAGVLEAETILFEKSS